jgi:hypothetical protein
LLAAAFVLTTNKTLLVGSGRGSASLAVLRTEGSLAPEGWPMFRRNPDGASRSPGPPFAPLVITSSPQPQNLLQGKKLTLRVKAEGTQPLSYQWRFNGRDLEGERSEQLTVSSVNPSHAGEYSALVRSATDALRSKTATVLVEGVPAITQLPDQSVIAGGSPIVLALRVHDFETQADDLALSVFSSQPGLLLPDAIRLGGSGTNRTLSLQPPSGKTGTTVITIRATDTAGATTETRFSLEVTRSPELHFAFPTTQGMAGSRVLVPVRVKGFSDVARFQFSAHWNTAAARFTGIERVFLPGAALEEFVGAPERNRPERGGGFDFDAAAV